MFCSDKNIPGANMAMSKARKQIDAANFKTAQLPEGEQLSNIVDMDFAH
jgi:hypothetical protein